MSYQFEPAQLLNPAQPLNQLNPAQPLPLSHFNFQTVLKLEDMFRTAWLRDLLNTFASNGSGVYVDIFPRWPCLLLILSPIQFHHPLHSLSLQINTLSQNPRVLTRHENRFWHLADWFTGVREARKKKKKGPKSDFTSKIVIFT